MVAAARQVPSGAVHVSKSRKNILGLVQGAFLSGTRMVRKALDSFAGDSLPPAQARESRALPPGGESRPRPVSEGRGLRSEIRRLEREIDRVHAQIAGGATPVTAGGPNTSMRELAALVSRARTLREELQRKRSDLARLERCVDRELRLSHALLPKGPTMKQARPAFEHGKGSLEPKRKEGLDAQQMHTNGVGTLVVEDDDEFEVVEDQGEPATDLAKN